MTKTELELTRKLVDLGAADPTPFGLGGDHCPFCGADWKRPHHEDCTSPHAADDNNRLHITKLLAELSEQTGTPVAQLIEAGQALFGTEAV